MRKIDGPAAFSRARRAAGLAVCVFLGAALWVPAMHIPFEPRLSDYLSSSGLPRVPRELSARHLALWADPKRRAAEMKKMRTSNAEWDFMARTFFVLSLANIALREPALKPECLTVMDRVIEETLRLENERGMHYFLMPYSRRGPFGAKGGRSLFEDGEIYAAALVCCDALEGQFEHVGDATVSVVGLF